MALTSDNRGERIQKFLSHAGVASRRQAEALIRAGRVTINGRPASLGDRVQRGDALKVDGRLIVQRRRHHYVLVNKPRGYVSTRSDPEGRPTVLDLVPPALRRGLFPVGRLDYHTEGLLLLTTDGELAHRMAHPRFGCTKTYEVKVKGHPTEGEIAKLRQGIRLEGYRTAPCRITAQPPPSGRRGQGVNSWWRVELKEGRSRQIREMFFRVGHPVQRLRRVAVGPLTDRMLPTGASRQLTAKEVAQLKNARRSGQRARPTPRSPRSVASPRPPSQGGRGRR